MIHSCEAPYTMTFHVRQNAVHIFWLYENNINRGEIVVW